jgi:polysaccharide export outer membrane protein
VLNAAQIVKIKPYDKISILVTSKDPQLAAMYNLMSSYNRLGQTNAAYSGGGYISYYTVDEQGNVDFPILGKIHVAGLSRTEIAEKVKTRIITSPEGLKNATVTVEFADLHVGVLGEVKSAGVVPIDRDQFTILNALEKVGDLTQYGNRKNVKVFRKIDNTVHTYEVDLTNFGELCSSPVYMLQQGDIVYVEPNKVKARQSTATGNTLLTPSFWMSVLSVAVSIAVLLK